MMRSMLTRRQFSKLVLGSGLVVSSKFDALSASPPSPTQGGQDAAAQDCDLLIKGGTVIDPGQNLHATLDVAVKNGKILEVSRDFPENRARRVVSAKDKIVTPGLIDILAHIFEGITVDGLNADLNCLAKGTTTV